MKKILSIILLFFFQFIFCQVENKIQKVVKIIEPQSFYLNGGTRNYLGGSSRTGFKIDLPPNTVQWYYAFTTESNKNNDQSIQLQNQLMSIITSVNNTNPVLSLIKIPQGQGLIDIYLTDKKGYDIFFQKNAFNLWTYDAPNSYIEGSRKNHREGKVMIDDVKKGTHYIVVRNTSSTVGINVKLEVVAIVEEKIINYNEWSKEVKNDLYNKIKEVVKNDYKSYDETKIEELSICIMTNLTKEVKPSDFLNMADYEIKLILKKNIENCLNLNSSK